MRAALEYTQLYGGAKNLREYDIVFSGNTRGDDNDLGTGFYTIKLNSPLPSLTRGDIRINTVTPRAVTLLPASAAAAGNSLFPLPLTNREVGGVSSSMFTVGDNRNLYFGGDYGRNLNVEINGFSFVRNRAQGGNGNAQNFGDGDVKANGGGGGGGLGAGGAITFLDGTLKITNSVFQDLDAKAGSGANFARGGNGSDMKGSVVKQRNSDGLDGSNGGISSIPTGRNFSGVMSYLPGYASIGGSGGNKGGEYGFVSNFNPYSGPFDGKNGNPATNLGPRGANWFGFGGGGGGGGGGRGRYSEFRITYGKPGEGGAGAPGGKFGGRGGQGGRGGSPNPSPGVNAEEGFAIGGAIATLSNGPNKFNPQRLVLEGVDFYSVTATASNPNRIIGSIVAGPR